MTTPTLSLVPKQNGYFTDPSGKLDIYFNSDGEIVIYDGEKSNNFVTIHTSDLSLIIESVQLLVKNGDTFGSLKESDNVVKVSDTTDPKAVSGDRPLWEKMRDAWIEGSDAAPPGLSNAAWAHGTEFELRVVADYLEKKHSADSIAHTAWEAAQWLRIQADKAMVKGNKMK